MKSTVDITRKFIFDAADIRGETVDLRQTCSDIFANHQYAPSVERLLGEFIGAVTLLSTTIKFDGLLTLQARSEGEIPVIMAECSHDQKVRAIARGAEEARTEEFQQLLTNGQLAITISPTNGKAYQSIVPLEGRNLAECLENYFLQSEQLATKIWLASNQTDCGGLLLQQLPVQINSSIDHREEQWQHVCQLANTIQPQELLELDSAQLLMRLFHQDKVHIFKPKAVKFQCSCNRERSSSALAALPPAELEEMLLEQGKISINCEFCNHHYLFDRRQLSPLLGENISTQIH
jgi:molecular chaperone Hsp33